MKFELKNTSSRMRRSKSQKGFTLIELLISMTITLVIVGLLMGMTKMAVGAWRTTSAKARSSSIAQDLLDTVGQDLEGMVVRTGNDDEWLFIRESENDGDELGQGANKEMVNPLEMSFFSAVTDRYYGQINTEDDLGGDVSMVRYRLIHQDMIEADGDKPVFILYRERVEPNVAFDTLLAQPEINGIKDGDDIVDRTNFLAENVFDFTVSFNFEYTVAASGAKGFRRITVQASPGGGSLRIQGNQILYGGAAITGPAGEALRLAGADISILVLSDGGMNALERKPISSPGELAVFLKENGRLYTKSVILPQP